MRIPDTIRGGFAGVPWAWRGRPNERRLFPFLFDHERVEPSEC